ncbi:MAG: GyrI-like domain-containing protein [Treponema sp.]|nr:GyrI-like domain-containing protein [Treponema sp.]
MDFKVKDLPEVAIIGKQGFCSEGNNIVKQIWEDANSHFGEVSSLALKESDGSLTGVWGAMSDQSMAFLPWTNNFSTGYYLAGVQVAPDAKAPEGWTKWILPPRKYLVVEVQMEEYAKTFSEVLNTILPQNKLKLCGAACDFTDPKSGKNKLFFPVQ